MSVAPGAIRYPNYEADVLAIVYFLSRDYGTRMNIDPYTCTVTSPLKVTVVSSQFRVLASYSIFGNAPHVMRGVRADNIFIEVEEEHLRGPRFEVISKSPVSQLRSTIRAVVAPIKRRSSRNNSEI